MYAEAFRPTWSRGTDARRFQHPLMKARWLAGPVGLGPPSPTAEGSEELVEGPQRRGPELARLEAVLFLAREPLASRKLAQAASLADGTKARTLVRALNRRYDEENCAFRILEVAGGFQLLTRPKFAPWLRRLHPAEVEIRLSSPALETLAVVAYRQPVVRADIEAIRGVQCGEILRQLMERDLVRIVGRSEDLGRPFLYGTSRHFLQVFGLYHLDELPRPETFRPTPVSPATRSGGELEPNTSADPQSNQPLDPQMTGGNVDVTTAATMEFVAHETLEQDPLAILEDAPASLLCLARKDEDEDEDDEDLDDDDDDEDDEWEEVDDEDEDLEELDEDEDDEEWEDDEDEEWDEDEDEEDEDWDEEEDDEDDDDWEEDEEEEDKGGDWE